MINIKTYIGLVKLLMSVKAENESKVRILTNCKLFIEKYSTKRKCKLTSLNIQLYHLFKINHAFVAREDNVHTSQDCLG